MPALALLLLLGSLSCRGPSAPPPAEPWGPPLAAPWTVSRSYASATGAAPGLVHAGVDLEAPCGSPVVAMADGTVEQQIADGGGWGNALVLRHDRPDGPVYLLLAHLDAVTLPSPGAGQRVRRGETVGEVGRSGNAAGCHLHLGARRDAAFETGYVPGPADTAGFLDPTPWIAPPGHR